MSYLQKYVRQLKPRNESYTPPVEKIQNFLYEASTEVSTALETVLGVAYESAAQNDPDILKTAMASDRKFKTAKVYWDTGNPVTDLANLQTFGQNIIAAGAPATGKFDFQEKGSLTKFWKDHGGRNVTSKADITLGGNQYSVKNADGAQLMSGKKGESTATVVAAFQEVNADADLSDSPVVVSLIDKISKLETVTTEGYYASAGNLQRLKADAGKHKNLYDLAVASKAEQDKFDKEFAVLKKAKTAARRDKTKIKKLEADFAKLWPPHGKVARGWKASKGRAKGWGGVGELGASGRPTLGRDLPKVLKKGPQPKELQTKLSTQNKKLTNKVDTYFKTNADAVQDELNAIFESNPDYKLAFVYEAASGNYKFGAGTNQVATDMLSWKSADNVKDFDIKMYDLKSRHSDIIKKYADKIELLVNWKSGSKTGHKGYNVWQNIRLSLGKLEEETNHVHNMLYEEYNKLTEQLDEGYLSEFKFFDKVKDLAGNFVAKIKELAGKIVDFFSEAINKIKEAAKDGIEAIGAVLGFEMDVNDSMRNKDLSVSI